MSIKPKIHAFSSVNYVRLHEKLGTYMYIVSLFYYRLVRRNSDSFTADTLHTPGIDSRMTIAVFLVTVTSRFAIAVTTAWFPRTDFRLGVVE